MRLTCSPTRSSTKKTFSVPVECEARPITRTGTEEVERLRPFGLALDDPPAEWPPDEWFRVKEDLVEHIPRLLGED